MQIPLALGLGDLDPGRWLGEHISELGLSMMTPWVLEGTKAGLDELAHIIGTATSPNLMSGWFSAEYWRVAAIGSLLTLPFLFAAAAQAVLRSEPGIIVKVVFGYLPLALLGIAIASPVVMLLLSATNEMCSIVASASANSGVSFLDTVGIKISNASFGGAAFFALIVGLFTLFAALMLTVELLIREASVYIVVLMLPLAFAAMVWPARRIWAVRVVELLISLILAKFVIVSVLSLAGAAIGSGGVSPVLMGMTLIMLSTLAPWTLMRMLPFTEVAAAAGTLRHEASRPVQAAAIHGRSMLGDRSNDSGDALAAMVRRMRANEWPPATSDESSSTRPEDGIAGPDDPHTSTPAPAGGSGGTSAGGGGSGGAGTGAGAAPSSDGAAQARAGGASVDDIIGTGRDERPGAGTDIDPRLLADPSDAPAVDITDSGRLIPPPPIGGDSGPGASESGGALASTPRESDSGEGE